MSNLKKPIRVLIVDDSAFIRKALEMMISENPHFRVVGTAKNGQEAVEMCKKLNPDVVTMDVEMPVMDGLTALKQIMQEHPTPVIMISTLTHEGAEVTMKALEAGAIDFIPKNIDFSTTEIIHIKKELYSKLISASQVDLHKQKESEKQHQSRLQERLKTKERILPAVADRYKIIAIASSTGGPKTLQNIFMNLPADLPVPIVVAQHMPPMFTRSFAQRLNELLPCQVMEAENNMEIKPGIIYIGKGGQHLVLKKLMNRIIIKLVEDVPGYIYKPSGDLLFNSVAELFGDKAIGVILTGMGDDGAKGLLQLKEKGAYTIAQDESSALIYGMPKVAAQLGAARTILPDYQIADKLALLLKSKSRIQQN